MRPHWLGLRARFVLVVFAGVALVASAAGMVSYIDTRHSLLAATQERLSDLTQAQAARLGAYLAEVAGRTKGLAVSIETRPPRGVDQMWSMLRAQLMADHRIFGMALGFAPFAHDPNRRRLALYMYRSPSGPKRASLDNLEYNYLRQPWYLAPSLLGRAVWSEPYYDEGGGGVIMTTLGVPVYRQGKLYCVVTADISIKDLKRGLRKMPGPSRGWTFVISRTGTFLAAPQDQWIMAESIFSLAESLQRPSLRKLGQRMIRGGVGVVSVKDWRTGQPAWLAFAPVAGVGWSFGAVVSEQDILAPAARLARRQGSIALAGLAVLVLVVWLLITRLTRPLTRLAQAARRLAAGDFSVKVAGVRPGDELGDLAEGFNQMVDDLNRYIEQLTETTAAKERIESELDLARRIQESILPRTYPPYPDRDEFDLFGLTIPARQVGGDFYDYFMIDHDHLGVVVGDVSGKGVPSALFMTVARTLIKSAAAHHLDTTEVLDETNRQILPGNDMCMFVTVFYGVYQISTGRLVYSSAGHPPPLVRRASGHVKQAERLAGMAVGVHDDLGLAVGSLQMEVGDLLLVYTDGLDEAIDPRGEMFGTARAMDWLSRTEVTTAPDIIDRLVRYHRAFTGPAEQFDDLTLLLLRRTT